MIVLEFIVLGIVQGLTEFLPVSSSGHLVLLSSIFGIEDSLFVSIFLHIATLISICVVMRKDIVYLIKNPFSNVMKRLFISTIATIIVVLLLHNFAKNSYVENYLPFFFMFTAVMLILSDVFSRKKTKDRNISLKQCLIVGFAQGIAIFPGISRSGTTISAGSIAGCDKNETAKFSFLLSIPIILASMVAEIFELVSTKMTINCDVLGLVLGFLSACIVGVFALKVMIKYTSKIKFIYFAIYLILLSIILFFI